ncbi:MAG: DUF2975 domain-containing protein [Chlamydiae bacterium]|nr:DUF2975 domain-containing protein [Chlamydiota bacterium]
MQKVVRTSYFLFWSVRFLSFLLPLITAGYWITGGYANIPLLSTALSASHENIPFSMGSLSELQKLLGFAVDCIPLTFSLIALHTLSKLFHNFSRLAFFEKYNVCLLRRAGWALVLGQAVHPLYIAALSLTLTYCNPPGQRVLMVNFGTDQCEVLIIGLGILLTSWIFHEAVLLREEQEAVV